MFTDLTEQRRTEAALRESTSLLGRLREANVLGVVTSTGQGAYEANDAFLDMIVYGREDLAAGRVSYRHGRCGLSGHARRSSNAASCARPKPFIPNDPAD